MKFQKTSLRKQSFISPQSSSITTIGDEKTLYQFTPNLTTSSSSLKPDSCFFSHIVSSFTRLVRNYTTLALSKLEWMNDEAVVRSDRLVLTWDVYMDIHIQQTIAVELWGDLPGHSSFQVRQGAKVGMKYVKDKTRCWAELYNNT